MSVINISSVFKQHNAFEEVTLDLFPQLYNEVHPRKYSIVPLALNSRVPAHGTM